MSVAIVIAASGSGSRFGGRIPKQFQDLGGMPVIARTLAAFDRLDITQEIVVAAPAGYVTHTYDIIARYKFAKVNMVVPGGINRAASVYSALKQLSPSTSIVLIHDGVRPFVTGELIKSVASAAKTHGAAIAGTPLTDTIKKVDDNRQVESTPNRKHYWQVQTPQGFAYDLIMKAYAQGEKDDILNQVTDDSSLVERLGIPVYMVEGSSGNIKITTREDLELGRLRLKGALK